MEFIFSLHIIFVDDISVQKGKLFGVWYNLVLKCTFGSNVHIHKRLFYGTINRVSLLISGLMIWSFLPVPPVFPLLWNAFLPRWRYSFLDEGMNPGRKVVLSVNYAYGQYLVKNTLSNSDGMTRHHCRSHLRGEGIPTRGSLTPKITLLL